VPAPFPSLVRTASRVTCLPKALCAYYPLKNLVALPSKRNGRGIAQAQLAIDIVHRFLEELVREDHTRLLLNVIERLARITQDKSLDPVFRDFKLDPLDVVPADLVPSEESRTRRWPQILELAAAQRRAYAQRQRRTQPAKKL
jgi:hypothetical protein